MMPIKYKKPAVFRVSTSPRCFKFPGGPAKMIVIINLFKYLLPVCLYEYKKAPQMRGVNFYLSYYSGLSSRIYSSVPGM